MRILRSRLLEMEGERRRKERGEMRKSLIGSGDRSERVRTYNFPQNRVTDHRLNLSVYNLERVLGGDLDQFTGALVKKDREERLKGAASGSDERQA
jgi:peptide chain release factor 1